MGCWLSSWRSCPGSGLEAAPVEVRFVEGAAHGLLLVRTVKGEIVGHRDCLQSTRTDHAEGRLTLRFKDGSLHDEIKTFSQQRVFTMLSYRLVQRGPSFPETLEASLDRKTGSYTVRSSGFEEHPLTFSAPGGQSYSAEFTERSDGEVYLFVNDSILGIPGSVDVFYRTNNKSKAKVTIAPVQ